MALRPGTQASSQGRAEGEVCHPTAQCLEPFFKGVSQELWKEAGLGQGQAAVSGALGKSATLLRSKVLLWAPTGLRARCVCRGRGRHSAGWATPGLSFWAIGGLTTGVPLGSMGTLAQGDVAHVTKTHSGAPSNGQLPP